MTKIIISLAMVFSGFAFMSCDTPQGIDKNLLALSMEYLHTVCCETVIVVPDPTPSYEWTAAYQCKVPADWDGASKQIVDDSFCN